MAKKSAGILAYRCGTGGLELLLVHPGGPFWAKKDLGAWSIPKGEYEEGEDPLAAAKREFEEELGVAPAGVFRALPEIKQKGGKAVLAWAVEMDLDVDKIRSNTFILEWPPRSGKMKEFPEVDKAQWFTPQEAREKINAVQVAWIDELERLDQQ